MYRTVDIRKLERRALTEYGRLLALADDIHAVLGRTHFMSSRAKNAAHAMYSLANALNLRAIDYRDPRGRPSAPETEVSP